MVFEWKNYSCDFSGIADTFLDQEAIKNTGCDEGFNKYYDYWLSDKETILNQNYWCKVVFNDCLPISVISVGKSRENEFTISEFIVSPNLRGKGYGTKILQELLKCSNEILGQEIKIAKAVIFQNNIASQKAFEKAGFIYTGTHLDGDALYYEYIV